MDTLTPLICDLLEWLEREPRTHGEVMDGWRTSCPRLPVWEEATDRRYVWRRGRFVEVTARGRSFLVEQRPTHVLDRLLVDGASGNLRRQ